MTKFKVFCLSLFLIILIISAGCVSPPGFEKKPEPTTKATKSTTIATTIPTPSPTPVPKQLPLFRVGNIALKSKGGSSGVGIVGLNTVINMYGTLELKRESLKSTDVWYTDGMQIVTWKPFSDIDKSYKFVEYGIDPARIPYYKTGQELSFPYVSPCNAVGDWNVNDGSVYKIRADGMAVKIRGNDVAVGNWRSLQTSEGRSYKIEWDYGPGPDYPLYIDKITVSKDLLKFDGADNYGRKFTGNWAFTYGAIGDEKSCSDWYGGNDWWKKELNVT